MLYTKWLLKVEGREEDQKILREKDKQERLKQSGAEKLGSSQSGCTRQKVLVKQYEGLMCLLAQWDMMMMKSVDIGPDQPTE